MESPSKDKKKKSKKRRLEDEVEASDIAPNKKKVKKQRLESVDSENDKNSKSHKDICKMKKKKKKKQSNKNSSSENTTPVNLEDATKTRDDAEDNDERAANNSTEVTKNISSDEVKCKFFVISTCSSFSS